MNTQVGAKPLGDQGRALLIDAMRGVAILGIFVMNLRNFSRPIARFDDAAFPSGELARADLWTWLGTGLVFEDKMVALLSLLFGAGMALAADRGGRFAWLHGRRMVLLFALGMIHAYGLWYGDILNTYAMCGLVVLPLVRLRAGVAIGVGALVFVLPVVIRFGPWWWDMVHDTPPGSRAPTLTQTIMRTAIGNEVEAQAGTWMDLARWRAHLNTAWHFLGGVQFGIWRSAGYMLIGMGLARAGVLTGRLPGGGRGVYAGLVAGGYGVGAVLWLLGTWGDLAGILGRDAAPSRLASVGAFSLKYLSAGAIALGHVGLLGLLVPWVCTTRPGAGAMRALSAAGRLALTNYLAQTLIAVTIFDGWAGGQYGRWTLYELLLLAIGVSAAQLVWSPLLLRVLHHGPVEWLWRSATYLRWQPFRRRGRRSDAGERAS